MNRRNFSAMMMAAGTVGTRAIAKVKETTRPNLLIVHTDEHNFRTLGCYRKLMSDDQSYVWGKGVKVDTPNLDRLANEGAICTSYYAASPVCTPSRAAFVSGLYPHHTGSPRNDMPLNDGLETFASVLKKEGYATAYVGKWHLDGDAKPGFEPPRKFGFSDNRYMMNRGHWKGLGHDKNGKPIVIGLIPEKESAKFNVASATPENFTTDFLTSRTLEIMERDKGQPFAVMLSIPDPHGPNPVRPPFNTMFDDLHFENPRTMEAPLENTPKWSRTKMVDSLEQDKMQDYFGMVKCIDENMGRLLQFLEDNGLDDNTIVVFTSDHGDLMGEHKRHNKGMPFEASAKVPFMVRWPAGIPAGKVIRTPYVNVDFSPTVLGLMKAPQIQGSHGYNDAAAFVSSEKEVKKDRMAYITTSHSNWTAAVSDRYKLVLSGDDVPWLFDLKKDPDELINFATNPEHAPRVKSMEKELVRQLKQFKDPILKKDIQFSEDQT